MFTTVLLVVLTLFVGVVAGLKIVAPITATSTDDKILSVLEKIPLEKILEYLKTRKV